MKHESPGKLRITIKEEGPPGRYAVRIRGKHPALQGTVDDTEYVDGFYSAVSILVGKLKSGFGPFGDE